MPRKLSHRNIGKAQCDICLQLINEVQPDENTSLLCDRCRLLEKNKAATELIGKQEHILAERFRKVRGKRLYDCVVGFSGGKDSSYIIHRLVSHYGARVLAYTCDNGFFNDYARDNIRNLINEMKIDHVWIRKPDEILQKMYRTSLLSEGWPCTACFFLAEDEGWKLAYEHEVPFFVHGRTPVQLFRQPTEDLFSSPESLICDNCAEYDPKRAFRIAGANMERLESVRNWLLQVPAMTDQPGSSNRPCHDDKIRGNNGFAPELLAFFLYEPYDEMNIMAYLESRTSWKPPQEKTRLSHGDCLAHNAAGYLFFHTHGEPFLKMEINASICLKAMTKEEGLELLERELEKISLIRREDFALLSQRTGFSVTALMLLPHYIKWRSRAARKYRALKNMGVP